MLFEERLAALRSLVRQEQWPECFEVVTLLMRQQGFRERAPEVLALSPLFRALHENRRLQNTTDRVAKDMWLRLVKAMGELAVGSGEGCLAALKELRPWFGSCPDFEAEYRVLRQREQEKARREIAAHFRRCDTTECQDGELRTIYGFIKKRMAVLPADERRELAQSLEERLARLIPEQEALSPLEEYCEERPGIDDGEQPVDNGETDDFPRQTFVDSATRAALLADLAESWPIMLEPLTLEISDDLPIDLTTPPPLMLAFFADHRFLLTDGDDGYVMIDFSAKTACRFTSPMFKQADPTDCTVDGTFLFAEKTEEEDKPGDTMWRAELSMERAAVTAKFNAREAFELEDGFSIKNVKICGERDTDYYLSIKHDEESYPAKVLRKRLAPRSTVETLQLCDLTELGLMRWTSCPDSFLVGGVGELRNVDRNLAVQESVKMVTGVYGMNWRRGYMYAVEGFRMTKRGRNLKFVKHFDKAHLFAMFEPGRVHGISELTNTALMALGSGRQSFYNFTNNKFSRKIRMGRVIPSELDGKWYCFDYQREQGILRLRDITRDLHGMLEWRDFFVLGKNLAKRSKRMDWFREPDNFLYRPSQWGDPPVGTNEEEDPELNPNHCQDHQ
jgi:hypothetical protein